MGRWTTRARRRGRLVAVLGLVPVLLAGPPVAHEGHGDVPDGVSDEEHLELDLVGESVTDVERQTLASRERLRAAGRLPTPAPREVVPAVRRSRVGTWGPVIDQPVVPVFAAVLPDRTVLMWDSTGDGPAEKTDDHGSTRAVVWDPRTGAQKRVDVPNYNIFCAGYAHLPNGDVLVVGGNKNKALDGIRQTHVFHWRTHRWTRGPDMAAERWYPSVTTTASGASLIVAGGTGRAEVMGTDGNLRSLTGFESYAQRFYPFLVPRLDGRVQLVGPNPHLDTMSIGGVGSMEPEPPLRDDIDRYYGSFATFRPGQTLISGGGPAHSRPTASALVVTDHRSGGTSVTWQRPMTLRRKQHSLTVLADGSVLATGGVDSSLRGGLVDMAHTVRAAERWDPDTGQWTLLSSARRSRQYHSTATLLPDGRVLTGGGGICGPCKDFGYMEKNVEVFTPPYLYREDGSLARRPSVRVGPEAVRVGSTFRATSPPSDDVSSLGLVRLGAPTHGVDQGQRFVPLDFTRSGGTLRVDAPDDTGTAPPSWYMLFAVDDRGVPSVADLVRIDPERGPTPRPVNLALNRRATASSSESGGLGPRLAADGNTATRWASAFSDDEWWQVDLGATRDVNAVRTVWETAYAARYRVQTSLDGRTWRTARTVTAAAPQARRTAFSTRPARYVRIRGDARGTPYGYSLLAVAVRGPGAQRR